MVAGFKLVEFNFQPVVVVICTALQPNNNGISMCVLLEEASVATRRHGESGPLTREKTTSVLHGILQALCLK